MNRKKPELPPDTDYLNTNPTLEAGRLAAQEANIPDRPQINEHRSIRMPARISLGENEAVTLGRINQLDY